MEIRSPAARNFFRDRATGIRATLAKADAAFREAEELANRAAERMAKLEAEKNQISSDLADETVYQIGPLRPRARGGRSHQARRRAGRDSTRRECESARARGLGACCGKGCPRPGAEYFSPAISRACAGFRRETGRRGATLKNSKVAKRYARALMGLSSDHAQLEAWGANWSALRG